MNYFLFENMRCLHIQCLLTVLFKGGTRWLLTLYNKTIATLKCALAGGLKAPSLSDGTMLCYEMAADTHGSCLAESTLGLKQYAIIVEGGKTDEGQGETLMALPFQRNGFS